MSAEKGALGESAPEVNHQPAAAPSVTPEVADAPLALAQKAALVAHYHKVVAAMTPEERAQLGSRASEIAARALEIMHASDGEAAASVPVPTPPAEGRPLQPADAPAYRAERPPGTFMLPFKTLGEALAEWEAAGRPGDDNSRAEAA
jgi:hypothetical protein